MSDRLAYIAWVLSRPLALPLDVVRQIVHELGKARRALLRHIRVARLIYYWLLEWDEYSRLIRQMTVRWLLLGGRSARYIRAEQRHRYYNTDVGAQWGMGSAWDR